jgi:Hydrazine synthase alpha subunit middle domain
VKRASAALLLAILGTVACSKDDSASGPLKNVEAITFLKRTIRVGGMGDVLQYTDYQPGGSLNRLSPPAADGVVTELCCSAFPGFEQLDIQSYDIAFDAKSIVFAGRLSADDHYSLYILTLNDKGEAAGPPTNLSINPNKHQVFPIFAAGQRIIFMTDENVEGDDFPQHQDEYERGTASQFASVTVMGTDKIMGAKNLSHSVYPTMLASGQVMFSRWDHITDDNAARLKLYNPDFTNLREAFGREGSSPTNSIFKAMEVEPGRVVALGSSRDRTIQAGKILDIRLGETIEGQYHQGEAYSSYRDLTPLVPGDRGPSSPTVGRYYDVTPIPGPAGKNGDDLFLLVSWADGPVEDETLEAAGIGPDFGLYLYDSKTQTRNPLYNDPNKSDSMPRILAPRPAPALIEGAAPNAFSETSGLLGGTTIMTTSLAPLAEPAVGMMVVEGFSGEEGPRDFGLAESDGAVYLGTAKRMDDDSWAAQVPANIPLRLMPVDRWGMSIVPEPVWITTRPGRAEVCGGCHEDRSTTTVVQPGVVQALASTPVSFDVARGGPTPRGLGLLTQPAGGPTLPETGAKSYDWEQDLQPIFTNAGCVNCHDGTSRVIDGKEANKTVRFISEADDMMIFEYRFDLTPTPDAGENYGVIYDDENMPMYSKSHFGLHVMVMDAEEMGIRLEGDLTPSIEAEHFRRSKLATLLNPQRLYPFDPDNDPANRFVPGAAQHPMELSTQEGGRALTWEETLIIMRNVDLGAQYYTRKSAGN